MRSIGTLSMPVGALNTSTPVEVSTTSALTPPGVSSKRLAVSASVEVSTTAESGGVGGSDGGGSDGGVGLELQK